jgi:hypothetical protein
MIMVVAFSIEVIRRKGPRNRLDTRLRRVFNVVLQHLRQENLRLNIGRYY